jgi:hypothetical protein
LIDQDRGFLLIERLEQQRGRVELASGPHRSSFEQLRPGQADEQDGRVPTQVGHVFDRIEQGRLGPLQILQNDYQRVAPTDGLEQPTDRPENLSAFCCRLGQADDLSDPFGRARRIFFASKDGGDPVSGLVWRLVPAEPSQLVDDLDERPQTRDLAVWQAAAAGDAGRLPEGSQELRDESRFSDAGSAYHG